MLSLWFRHTFKDLIVFFTKVQRTGVRGCCSRGYPKALTLSSFGCRLSNGLATITFIGKWRGFHGMWGVSGSLPGRPKPKPSPYWGVSQNYGYLFGGPIVCLGLYWGSPILGSYQVMPEGLDPQQTSNLHTTSWAFLLQEPFS